jgi:hypothetical protein
LLEEILEGTTTADCAGAPAVGSCLLLLSLTDVADAAANNQKVWQQQKKSCPGLLKQKLTCNRNCPETAVVLQPFHFASKTLMMSNASSVATDRGCAGNLECRR